MEKILPVDSELQKKYVNNYKEKEEVQGHAKKSLELFGIPSGRTPSFYILGPALSM